MKLMALNEILSNVRAARLVVRDATISALYHGCIKADVSWAKDMTRQDVGSFDKALRGFMPLKWVGNDNEGDKGEYVYSLDKALKFCAGANEGDAPRFTQETTWEDFYPVMVAEWDKANTKVAAPVVEKTREEILKGFDKDFDRLLKKLKKEGVTLQEVMNRRTTTA